MVHTLSFNSRTPGGVRPYMADVATKVVDVSIHAPREGCDTIVGTNMPADIGFNSRTPGGVRPRVLSSEVSQAEFQFTHPGRGATVWCKVAYYGADKQA